MKRTSFLEAARSGISGDDESSLEELEKKLNKLNHKIEVKRDKFEVERDNLLNQINQKKALDVDSDADANQLISHEVIINFVAELDEVDRYYDLKQHLRDTYDIMQLHGKREDMIQSLFERVKQRNIYDNCDKDIELAAEAYVEEVRSPGIRRQFEKFAIEQKKWKLIELYGAREEYTEEQRKRVDIMLPGLIYDEPETWDLYALSSPVWKLAIQTREKGIELDEDIRVELRKINKSEPLFYHMHFVCGKMPVVLPKNTVTAINLPRYVTRFDVERSLSACGKIVHVEVESGKRKSTMVHVTFSNKRAANRALGPRVIEEETIVITTPESAPDRLQPTDVRSASETKDAAGAALLKYSELREKYKKMSTRGISAVNKAAGGGGIPDKQQSTRLEVVSGAEGMPDKKQKRNLTSKKDGASKAPSRKSTRRRHCS